MRALQLLDGLQIHGRVFADRGMRTASGLDAGHSIGRQDALADQKFGILAGVNVVRDDSQVHRRPEALAQHMNQRGLPAADWSGDADAKRAMSVMVVHKFKTENIAAPAAERWPARR